VTSDFFVKKSFDSEEKLEPTLLTRLLNENTPEGKKKRTVSINLPNVATFLLQTKMSSIQCLLFVQNFVLKLNKGKKSVAALPLFSKIGFSLSLFDPNVMEQRDRGNIHKTFKVKFLKSS
jgi:hypothetical protein